ncbi:hypothetical protein L218DRAFT_953462, partial [Marasmius fiardii PR-910]
MKFFQAKYGTTGGMTNNTWYDEDHRAVYKVHTPFKFANRTTTIIKLLGHKVEVNPFGEESDDAEGQIQGGSSTGKTSPPTRHESSGAPNTPSSVDPDKINDGNWEVDELVGSQPPGASPDGLRHHHQAVGDNFIYLAQIDWHVLASSKLRLGDGLEVSARNFFRKEDWGPYTKHRVFTGKDGKEYKWLLKSFHSELITNNENKTIVAKFTQKILFGKNKSPGFLEIFPPGEHMID